MTVDSRDLGIPSCEIQLGVTRTRMYACHSLKAKIRLYLNYLPLFDRVSLFCLYRIISLTDLPYSSLYNIMYGPLYNLRSLFFTSCIHLKPYI
jgi:hypothetical protein